MGAGFLSVSPEWLDTMKIPLLAGRGFRASDIYLSAGKSGAAIVNQTFARQYFNGQNPVGRTFATTTGGLRDVQFRIVGLVGDARYRNMREPLGSGGL